MPKLCAALVAVVVFVGLAIAQGEETGEQPQPPYQPFGALVAALQSDGSVRLTASVYGVAPGSASIARAPLGGVATATFKDASKVVVDKPEAGQRHVYRLEALGRVLASAVVDLRARPTLKFLGGTAKRAVFEVTNPGEAAVRVIVRPGAEIAGAALDDLGRVREVATGVVFLATSVVDATVGTPRLSVIEDGSGKSVVGLDGQPLMLSVVEGKATGASVMAASVKLGLDALRLDEGQSLDLPLK